jgi:hypothetical protein
MFRDMSDCLPQCAQNMKSLHAKWTISETEVGMKLRRWLSIRRRARRVLQGVRVDIRRSRL